MHACNTCTLEAKTVRLGIQGQNGGHSENTSQNKQAKDMKVLSNRL